MTTHEGGEDIRTRWIPVVSVLFSLFLYIIGCVTILFIHSIRWSLLIYNRPNYFIVLAPASLQSELKIEYCASCLSLTLPIGVGSDQA